MQKYGRSVACAGLSWWMALGVAVAGAQAPVVPTDHYGPPVCSAEARPAEGAKRMSVAKARAIEELGAGDVHALLSAEPFENFDIARYRLADYADCVGTGGCYWADIDAQYKRAEAALEREVSSRKAGEKLAIVFDIDETSLSSYCEMQRENYGYVQKMNWTWVVGPEAAIAIPGAVRLFHLARKDGVDVFFITGRPGEQAEATARNLEAAGFHGWKGLALRDAREKGLSTIDYKSGRRRAIVAEGYRIVMSVGDQWSDLRGDPQAEVNVKVPNPFYFLP